MREGGRGGSFVAILTTVACSFEGRRFVSYISYKVIFYIVCMSLNEPRLRTTIKLVVVRRAWVENHLRNNMKRGALSLYVHAMNSEFLFRSEKYVTLSFIFFLFNVM